MKVFVCHSHEDQGVYTAFCAALDGAGIERWDVSEMQPGASLHGQLREAIRHCDQCVFIATERSVASKWCLAEAGAFWGAAKRVIVYEADPDLDRDELPPQFVADLRTSDIARVMAALQSTIPTRHAEFFPTAGDFGAERDWIDLVSEAQSGFDVAGIALAGWRRTRDFDRLALEKADAGCRLRFLSMHPDNPMLSDIVYRNENKIEVVNIITAGQPFYARLAEHDNIEFRQLRAGMPHFFVSMSDRRAVVVQYLSSATWGAGPMLVSRVGSAMYNVVRAEFDFLWDAAITGCA